MRLTSGTPVPTIRLPAIDGTTCDTSTLRGQRYLLGFFRFAGCPFCSMRLHDLVQACPDFPDDFTVVAVFDAPLDHLKATTKRHRAPFPILADESNHAYRAFGIEHSIVGVFKGITTRIPTLVRATLRGYIPLQTRGSMTTMPADFLIDADGTIAVAYYGSDEGDHLPIPDVAAFAQSSVER